MLPIFTTLEDVNNLMAYMKNKPTGATSAEIKAALGSNVIDPRKVTAYAAWQLLERNGDKFKLLDRGWRYARKPAEEPVILREVIDSIVPYRSALEWAFYQGMAEVINVDVAAHWHEHHSGVAGTENENTLKDAAVCFFNVCQGAALGKMVVGRRGQATRLQFSTSELKTLIEFGPSSMPASAIEEERIAEKPQEPGNGGEGVVQPPAPNESTTNQIKNQLRIFITHGKNMTLVEQVQTMFGLGTFEYDVAEEEETAAIPVPEKFFPPCVDVKRVLSS